MGVFRQLGDPVCPDCLCQHHDAAYAEHAATTTPAAVNTLFDTIANGITIVQTQITTTETCCIVVNAAALVPSTSPPGAIHIERPVGTDRSQQHDVVTSNEVNLYHVAAWEVLPPGIYTYYAVNRLGMNQMTMAAWIKVVASDCEG